MLYIDFEDHPGSVKARFRALGVSNEILNNPNRIAYLRSDEPIGDNDDGWSSLWAIIHRVQPEIAVLDGVSESMMLEGLDPLSTPDTARWIKLLPKSIAGADSQPAVCVIDHQTKSTEGRKGWAFGSQHKKAGTDGAAYDVAAVRKLTRVFTGLDPVEGVVSVRVAKDRIGYVRGHAPGDQAATVRLTAWPDGGVTYEATTDAIARDHGLRLELAKFIDGAGGPSKRGIRDAVGARAEHVDQALGGMVMDKCVTVELDGRAHRHYLTDKGREVYALDGDE